MSMPSQPHELIGRLVRLEPLRPSHAPALFPSASDPEVWRWKLVPRPQSTEELATLIGETLIGPGRWPFVVSLLDGPPIGSTTLANFDWTHGSVEMGFTWFERSRWGQGYNEDSKRLLLHHCFDNLGMHRVEWQVDDQNVRSIASLKRLGFTFEGTHRGACETGRHTTRLPLLQPPHRRVARMHGSPRQGDRRASRRTELVRRRRKGYGRSLKCLGRRYRTRRVPVGSHWSYSWTGATRGAKTMASIWSARTHVTGPKEMIMWGSASAATRMSTASSHA